MKLPNIAGIVGVVKTFTMANRPEILLGTSLTATVGAIVLAAKGGWDARGIVDDERMSRVASPEPPFDTFLEYKEEFEKDAPEITVKEKIQLTWLCYMPATIAGATALGSTGGLHLVHVKEKKALVTAGLAALEEVKKEALQFEKDNLGVVSNDEKQKILEERAQNTPIGEEGNSHVQSSDDYVEEMYLVRDGRTGRDIWSNQHRIEDALIEVNSVLNGSGNVELNYFYTKAGFNSVPDGLNCGWSGALVDVQWEETKRDDGRPVRVFTFRPTPSPGYDDAHQ